MHGRVDKLGRHGRGCRELESTACPPKNKLGRNPAAACLSNRPPVYNHCNRRVLSYRPGFYVGKNDCLKISRFELLLLEKWSRCSFSYSSQEVQLETLDIIYKIKLRIPWKREEGRLVRQGLQDPRSGRVVKSLFFCFWFCFVTYIPDLLLKKSATQKCQQRQTTKATLCSQRTSSLAKRKLLDTNHCTSAKQHRKSCGPSPTLQWGQVESLDSTLARL